MLIFRDAHRLLRVLEAYPVMIYVHTHSKIDLSEYGTSYLYSYGT